MGDVMAEHSKTPWRLGKNGGDDTVFAGNRVVAMCDTDVNAPHVDKANAAFIVRAVNCHAELVAALELLVADVAGYETWQRPCHAVDVAKSALAKARGETP